MGSQPETGRAAPGLHLDARQRAMLEEMGVRVWWPGAAPEVAAAAAELPPRPGAVRPHLHSPSGAVPGAAAQAPAARQRPAAVPAVAVAAVAAAQPAAAPLSPTAPGAWTLQAPQPLFPNADPQHTPAALGAGWLIVVEGRAGSDPLAGDAGRLLENMLRALQLHHHPRAFVCLLDTLPASEAPGPAGRETIAAAIAAVQPSVLLLLGRAVARALLGRSDPLGRLRAERLQVAGVPTVVSYDAAYLLRAPPETKALAWADLCRARALAGAAAGTGAASPHA